MSFVSQINTLKDYKELFNLIVKTSLSKLLIEKLCEELFQFTRKACDHFIFINKKNLTLHCFEHLALFYKNQISVWCKKYQFKAHEDQRYYFYLFIYIYLSII